MIVKMGAVTGFKAVYGDQWAVLGSNTNLISVSPSQSQPMVYTPKGNILNDVYDGNVTITVRLSEKPRVTQGENNAKDDADLKKFVEVIEGRGNDGKFLASSIFGALLADQTFSGACGYVKNIAVQTCKTMQMENSFYCYALIDVSVGNIKKC